MPYTTLITVTNKRAIIPLNLSKIFAIRLHTHTNIYPNYVNLSRNR